MKESERGRNVKGFYTMFQKKNWTSYVLLEIFMEFVAVKADMMK